MQAERIQKVLAKLGIASRREIEKWLQSNRIKVNGKLAKVGDKITDQDTCLIDDKFVSLRGLTQIDKSVEVLILNKPAGYLCSRKDISSPSSNNLEASELSTNKRKLVFDLLPKNPKQGRWIQVGRLDLNTSGLLLFTNHGELANKLMHPSSQIARIYQCRVFGEVTTSAIEKLSHGVKIDNRHLAKFKSIESLCSAKKSFKLKKQMVDDDTQEKKQGAKNSWWQVSIYEGRNREVRKMFQSVGVKVNRLIRIQYGKISLPLNLEEGNYRMLSQSQINALMSELGLKQS